MLAELTQAKNILKQTYGYEKFKAIQAKSIESILSGHDTFVIMPTGGGKSICYQIPALIFSGVTLVISPLISLMKDQVDGLEALGIRAGVLNSSLGSKDYQQVMNQLRAGEIQLLYVAPERLSNGDFLNACRSLDIAFVAIDEAHCVSQWGHDFRPSYRDIATFVEELAKRPVVAAFTASATPEVRLDIIRELRLQQVNIYRSSFNRKNLKLDVRQNIAKDAYLTQYIFAHPKDCGIIYCNTRKEVERLAQLLQETGIDAAAYHAGLADEVRSQMQNDFIYDKKNVMVATNAFGMGINKSNVRYVIHYQMPKNLESYYQEIGRAGRDGLESDTILFFSQGDVFLHKYFIDQSPTADEYRHNELNKLQAMVDYAHTDDCLRTYMLGYFGEKFPGNCANCSSCLAEGTIVDYTEDATTILRSIQSLERPIGIVSLTAMLRGSRSKKIHQLGLSNNFYYGHWSNRKNADVKNFIYKLIAHQYLALSLGEYPVITVAPAGEEVLADDVQVLFKEITMPIAQQAAADDLLLERLKILRLNLAIGEGKASYMVFSDATLKDMVQKLPQSQEEMMTVSGVGEYKWQHYGQPFLDEICQYCQAHNPARPTVSKEKRQRRSGQTDARNTVDITLDYLRKNHSIKQTAEIRERAVSTIIGHIIKRVEAYDFPLDWDEIIETEKVNKILTARNDLHTSSVKTIQTHLDDETITYTDIQIALLKDQLS